MSGWAHKLCIVRGCGAGVTPRAEVTPGWVGLLLLWAIHWPCPCSERDTHSWGPVSLEEAQPGARDKQRGLPSQPSPGALVALWRLDSIPTLLHPPLCLPPCQAVAPEARPDVQEAYQRVQEVCKADKR